MIVTTQTASCEKVLDINTRKQMLKRDNRCFVCLGKNHRPDQCEPTKSCRRCRGKHHQSICPTSKPLPNSKDDPPPPQKTPTDPPKSNVVQDSSTQATPVVNTATATSKERREVLLQTVFTNVQSPDGSKEIKARILLDSGSQRSYVTNSLKSKLNLNPVKTETLNLNTFGNKRLTKQKCDLVEVSLKGTNSYHSISVLCFPKICSPLPTTIDISQYPYLKDLEFADCSVLNGHDTNSDIDILIGSDYYFDFILENIVRGDGGLVAVESEFGWLVSGPKTCNEEFTGVSCTNLIIEENYPFSNPEFRVENGSNDELKSIVERFWETEAIGVENKPKHDRTDFLRNTKFKAEEGHYEVKLP